jgi:hypothetical protein
MSGLLPSLSSLYSGFEGLFRGRSASGKRQILNGTENVPVAQRILGARKPPERADATRDAQGAARRAPGDQWGTDYMGQ